MNENVISAKLDCRFVTTRSIWQYDYGQILSINGVDLPAATEVHFGLQEKSGNTLSRIGTTVDGVTTVKIPDELLKNNEKNGNYTIYAFVYVTNEKSGKTECRISIPVNGRPKPEIPSEDPETDPDIFHETVTAVNDAADRAEVAEKSAKESANQANSALSEIKETADNLSETVEKADTLDGELKEKIEKGEGIVENIKDKITAPQSPEPGKILKIKSVNEDGTFVCEWADSGSNLDVRINGKSIVQDGVAEIPRAKYGLLGLVPGQLVQRILNNCYIKLMMLQLR